MKKYLVVWRNASGAAVQTYANDDSSPRIFSSDIDETSSAPWTTKDDLIALVEARKPFKPVKLDVSVAKTCLGWDV